MAPKSNGAAGRGIEKGVGQVVGTSHHPAWIGFLVNMGVGPAYDLRIRLAKKTGRDPREYPLGEKEVRIPVLAPFDWRVGLPEDASNRVKYVQFFEWNFSGEATERYIILGKCFDSYRNELTIRLFFDGEGRVYTEEES